MSEHTVRAADHEAPRAQPVGSHARRGLRGPGAHFGIHPAFYRVGFVVLTLIGGAGILIYLAAALVIPDEGKEDSIAAEVLREQPRRAPGR